VLIGRAWRRTVKTAHNIVDRRDIRVDPRDYNQGFRDPAMAKTSPAVSTAATAPSYEDALGELDRLVAAMEAGQLPLDRLLESYKRGAELLSFCRSRLEAVEQQVKVLEDGQLKPWAAQA
jgi:exodeoxyribonuclease VII small subunit